MKIRRKAAVIYPKKKRGAASGIQMKSVSRGGGEGGSNKRIDGEEGGHLEDEMQAKERTGIRTEEESRSTE